MSNHTPPSFERHCDVCVVGGSAAGLAAALQLTRQRRSVIVVDAGDPRNAPAAHMHGYLGFDGEAPAALVGKGRSEVRSYGGEVVPGRVVGVQRHDDDFEVALTGGHRIIARRVLAATGLVDELPDIEGVAEHWGGDVIHCPFCHGYEVRDLRIAAIVTHPMGLHPVRLFAHLTDRLVVLVHDGAGVGDDELAALRASGVDVREGPVRRIVTGSDGHIAGVELVDGAVIDAEVVAVGPRFRARTEAFAPLGLSAVEHPTGLGNALATDDLGATEVPGVYAAGNVTDPSQQVLQAAAEGARVGAMIAFDLAADDTAADPGADAATAQRQSAGEAEWDHRYSGDQMWSGRPNGSLVAEVADLAPGSALDVGAGEGGDALWLAESGWVVTASDISSRGLARIAAAAGSRGVAIETLHVDANALRALPRDAFTLVSASYASIPRTPDHRAVHNMLGAVAPGGTLVVLSHAPGAMHEPIDVNMASRPFDPDAYERVEDFAAAVESTPGWVVELHETRPRPPGATSAHHVDDVILRARRTS